MANERFDDFLDRLIRLFESILYKFDNCSNNKMYNFDFITINNSSKKLCTYYVHIILHIYNYSKWINKEKERTIKKDSGWNEILS